MIQNIKVKNNKYWKYYYYSILNKNENMLYFRFDTRAVSSIRKDKTFVTARSYLVAFLSL